MGATPVGFTYQQRATRANHAQNASVEERLEALANYGFQCLCEKCLREEAECGASVEQQKLHENGLLGPEKDDYDSEGRINPIDGETFLQSRRNELDKEWKESATNAMSVRIHVLRCLEAVCARDFVSAARLDLYSSNDCIPNCSRKSRPDAADSLLGWQSSRGSDHAPQSIRS
jgi:hypothetical protein